MLFIWSLQLVKNRSKSGMWWMPMDMFASERQWCLPDESQHWKKGDGNAIWPHKTPPVSYVFSVLLQEEQGFGGCRIAPCWQWGVLVWHIQPGQLVWAHGTCLEGMRWVILPVFWLSHHHITPSFRSSPNSVMRCRDGGVSLMCLVWCGQRAWMLWCPGKALTITFLENFERRRINLTPGLVCQSGASML